MAENVKACIIGCALGDAYGSAFAASEMPMAGPQWQLSATTQLMLATCESLLKNESLDTMAISVRMLEWHKNARVSNPDPATLMALLEMAAGKSYKLAGQKGLVSSNNGLIPRTTILGFFLDMNREADRKTLKEVCRITHQNDETYAAALAALLAIRLIRNDRQNFIPHIIKMIPESEVKERMIAIGKSPGLAVREIGKKYGASSNVVDSVPLAIYASRLSTTGSYAGMMKEIVSAGGEINGNCAIAGMIAGHYLGMGKFPKDWLERLKSVARFDVLDGIASAFERTIEAKTGIRKLF